MIVSIEWSFMLALYGDVDAMVKILKERARRWVRLRASASDSDPVAIKYDALLNRLCQHCYYCSGEAFDLMRPRI